MKLTKEQRSQIMKNAWARKKQSTTKTIKMISNHTNLIEEHNQFIARVDTRIKEIQKVIDNLNIEKNALENILSTSPQPTTNKG